VLDGGDVIHWQPRHETNNWLLHLLFERLEALKFTDVKELLCHLTLRGSVIWSADDPTVYLDGDVFGKSRSNGQGVDLIFPTGDKRPGGDFATWFWLVRESTGPQPPTCNAGGPYSGTVGNPIQFDGSASTDPDGTITAYLWNFNDGSTDNGPTPSHTFHAAGTFTVSLTVTDNEGLSSTCTTNAVITTSPGLKISVNVDQITITGKVTDATGGPVDGANVQLVNADTAQLGPQTTTNTQGTFRFDNVLPGNYRVVATFRGLTVQSKKVTIPGGHA
jgi:hypothetical protein